MVLAGAAGAQWGRSQLHVTRVTCKEAQPAGSRHLGPPWEPSNSDITFMG